MEDKNNKKGKVFELILGDDAMINGVSTISFVEHPAIEENFMYFSKEAERERYKFAEVGEKKMVYGPAMIPNQLIARKDKNDEIYHVKFASETIAKCQELFFKRGHQRQSNVEHMFALDGVSVVESWLIEDPKNDKSSALGFKNLTKGTWMCAYKIDNHGLWEGIKNGEVKGFSIEGAFIEELVKMSETNQVYTDDEIYNQLEKIAKSDASDDEIYNQIKELLSKKSE